MSEYPPVYGKEMKGVLSEFKTPLTIEQQGDSLVPPNDMGDVGLASARDTVPDPLSLISVIGKG
jgi:hypothetical protein